MVTRCEVSQLHTAPIYPQKNSANDHMKPVEASEHIKRRPENAIRNRKRSVVILRNLDESKYHAIYNGQAQSYKSLPLSVKQ